MQILQKLFFNSLRVLNIYSLSDNRYTNKEHLLTDTAKGHENTSFLAMSTLSG